MDRAHVYHIQDPAFPADITHGYVGVVKAAKGAAKRFAEHRTSNCPMHRFIRDLNLTFEKDVKIVFRGTLAECYEREHQLRPSQRIGWNLATGGGGPYHGIEGLSEFRSDLQKLRMKNPKLRKQQGETFKTNYYASSESQRIRSDRAREHMSNPEKRAKCLGALHKKIRCPFCAFRSNAGNLSRHISSKHST